MCWGHPSLSRAATSVLNWYKMACHREITPTAISEPRFHAPLHIFPPPPGPAGGVRRAPEGCSLVAFNATLLTLVLEILCGIFCEVNRPKMTVWALGGLSNGTVLPIMANILHRLIRMKFMSMLSIYVQSGTQAFLLKNYCSFNTKSYYSDVCEYHPQILAEICIDACCCDFSAVAARGKYAGFLLLPGEQQPRGDSTITGGISRRGYLDHAFKPRCTPHRRHCHTSLDLVATSMHFHATLLIIRNMCAMCWKSHF